MEPGEPPADNTPRRYSHVLADDDTPRRYSHVLADLVQNFKADQWLRVAVYPGRGAFGDAATLRDRRDEWPAGTTWEFRGAWDDDGASMLYARYRD